MNFRADILPWNFLAAVFFGAVPSVAGIQANPEGGSAHAPALADSRTIHVREARLRPDGEWAVYAVDHGDGATWELYSVPLAGGPTVAIAGPLTSPPGAPWLISPDGERVVYLDGDLFSVPIDGHAEPVRLNDPAAGEPRDFVLDADGSSVVYRSAPAGRYLGLFSAPLDGHAAPLELVAPNEQGDVASSCRISESTRAVVFASRHADGLTTRLYSVPLAGGPLVALSDPRRGIDGFQLSPDGAHVVYRDSREARQLTALRTVPVDGALEPVELSGPLAPGEDIQEFQLSAGGEWVVYLADQGNGRNELYSVPLDASSPARALAWDVVSSFQLHEGGDLVLYQADRGGDERFALFAAPLDGSSEPRELSAPLAPGAHVGWFAITPDGTRVVYQVHRGDSPGPLSELWQVALAPSLVRSKLAEADGARALELSPDGGRLVYQDRSARLFSLRLDGSALPLELAAGRGARTFELGPDGAQVLGLVSGADGGDELLLLDADHPPGARALLPHAQAGSWVGGPPGQQNAAAGGGFRDFSFGTSGTSTPTGEKPESKLWFNDGSWWGSLWNDAAADYHIYRLNGATQTWVDTGTVLDERSSKADVLWDGASQKLYVASHIFTTNAQPTVDNFARLFRYSYSTASRSYTLDSGFPVDITRGNAEALTIAKDSQGRLWATWVEASKVMINHSLASDAQWATPAVLPASASAVSLTTDDISAVLAFGGNRIGVMWSNQVTFNTYFAVHRDTDAATVWQAEEIVSPNANCSGTCSDDLFNLKSDAAGRVFAVLKTSLDTADQPLELVCVRGTSGGWVSTVFGLGRDHHTRPILLLDEQNGRVFVFATTPEEGGAIYFKSAPLSDLRFEPGLGTPFIQSSADITINNATSTKQNLNNQTDLLVLASDQNTRFYLHNFIDLGPAGSPPTIGSFNPTSGPAGTSVTITGSNFSGTNSVRFNGTAAGFTVVSSTRIDTAVPNGATTGRISVTTPNGSATSSGNFTVTQPSGGPTISSFTPIGGPVGTAVTITGSNFTGASRVRFDGTAAGFRVDSSTRIDTVVPAGATTGKITVTTPNGTATSSEGFIVTHAPTISSFNPPGGPVGTNVTINGDHFSGATSVRFDGRSASYDVASNTRINATVPAGATTGRITVTTASGTGTSSANFIVTQAPTISSFSPPGGPAGTAVTINGDHFSGATRVRFNGTSAGYRVVSNTRIDATVPAGATTGRIEVTTPSGSDTSSTSFVVTQAPTISSFSPGSGPVGTQVVVRGSSFNGTTRVEFNGKAASFRVESSTEIRATVPAGASSGRIRVTTPSGSGTSSSDFRVTRPPVINTFVPGIGVVATPVTITGSGFSGASKVEFNGTRATVFTVIDDHVIVTFVPFGARTGKIRVTTSQGSGESSNDFTVIGL